MLCVCAETDTYRRVARAEVEDADVVLEIGRCVVARSEWGHSALKHYEMRLVHGHFEYRALRDEDTLIMHCIIRTRVHIKHFIIKMTLRI